MNLPRIFYPTRHDHCQGSANARVRIPATTVHKGEQSGGLVGYKSVKHQMQRLFAPQRATLSTQETFREFSSTALYKIIRHNYRFKAQGSDKERPPQCRTFDPFSCSPQSLDVSELKAPSWPKASNASPSIRPWLYDSPIQT